MRRSSPLPKPPHRRRSRSAAPQGQKRPNQSPARGLWSPHSSSSGAPGFRRAPCKSPIAAAGMTHALEISLCTPMCQAVLRKSFWSTQQTNRARATRQPMRRRQWRIAGWAKRFDQALVRRSSPLPKPPAHPCPSSPTAVSG